ncbi:MAG: hypothetical protein ACKOV8_05220 [Phycisphaerales bacterium]
MGPCSLSAVLAAAACSVALAGEYEFRVKPTSTLLFGAGLNAPITGSFVGNWDATANPAGTRTLPGLFGGTATTNTPIPYTGDLASGVDTDRVPTGGFRVRIPTDGRDASIEGLELDLLGGEPAPLAVTVDLVFQTFRTRQPTSTYIGFEALPPIPIATGQVSAIRVTQVGPAPATTVETPMGTTFTANVPVEFALQATFLGQPIADQVIPAVLPVSGMVTDGEMPIASFSFKDGFSVPLPKLPGFESQAVALPTIFPPGQTANLLFTGTIDGPAGAFGVSIDTTIELGGNPLPMDLNVDGCINADDLGMLLAAWGAAPKNPADFNHDGTIDGEDLGMMLGCWTRD